MIEEDPRIDPDGLRDVRFPGSFRRYDSKAVDDFLESLASRVAATNELVEDLRRQLAEVESRPRAESAEDRSPFDTPDLSTVSEDELVQLVGEETTHVLTTARRAAGEIRSKAEESAARLIREATAEAAEVSESAAVEAGELTAQASAARDEAVAAAEAEAAEIRSAAQEAADQAVAGAEAEVEALQVSMDEDRRAAETEAERIIEEAKDEGRAMVAEAKKLRIRILEDLQRRRDLGRSQVERLAAGRDQLLEAYAAVRANLDEITGRLEVGLLEMTSEHDPLLEDGFAGIVVSRMIEEESEELEAASHAGDEVDRPEAADEDAPPGGTPGLEEDSAGGAGDADVSAGGPADTDVDALFARLRAERAESVSQAQAVLEDGGDEAGATADERDTEASADQAEGREDAGHTGDAGDEVGAPADNGAGTDLVPAELLAAEEAVTARRKTVDPLDKELARALKRQLADEQNQVLDVLRRTESTEPDALFPPLAEHAAGYAEVASKSLTAAAEAGAAQVDGAGGEVDVTDLASELGTALIEPFRRRIERSIADVDGDADALDERLRALYREWKVEHIGAATTDSLLSAYALGQYTAAPEGATLRWLIDPDQGPCPDAQDNALAGTVPKGEPFPTGDLCPQAHRGCRCLLVVES
jgi:cell division septum initiation protein DivIVA